MYKGRIRRVQTKSWCLQGSPHSFPNLFIKHRMISIFSGCQRPNLNHFPLVVVSLPVCWTVTSQSNPQMRIKQGLEIRYEKVLSPQWLLYTSLPLLSVLLSLPPVCHTHSRPEPFPAYLWQKSKNTHMQMRWRLRHYLEAIMFSVS